MKTERAQLTVIEKEMGITHKDFYDGLPNLLNDIPYHQNEGTIKFQLDGKNLEIILAPEKVRELGQSMRLPVTLVTLRFFGFPEEKISGFIKRFDLQFMKGGG